MLLYHIIVLLLRLSLDRVNFTHVFVVNELAFFAIRTISRCLVMPLLAHFRFVVFVKTLRRRFNNQLGVTVRVSTLIIELTDATFHEVAAQLRLIIDLEVFNVP